MRDTCEGSGTEIGHFATKELLHELILLVVCILLQDCDFASNNFKISRLELKSYLL
jgi:hypothetical protein